MLDGRRCRIWLSSPRGSMLCTGARIPEYARPMTRCRSLSDCGGTPVLAGGCRHFNSLQGEVAPDQALAARDSWRGDLLQGPVAQEQPFHSSARTPRPGAPTETSCQVPLWRLHSRYSNRRPRPPHAPLHTQTPDRPLTSHATGLEFVDGLGGLAGPPWFSAGSPSLGSGG